MKRILLLLALLCVAPSVRTFAALGNSESEIAELFGKPVDQGFPDKNRNFQENLLKFDICQSEKSIFSLSITYLLI